MNIIDQQTTKEDLLKEYKTYPGTMGENFLSEKPFYESRILPLFFEIPKGSKVLDVGCNDGTFIQMLKERRECDVTGIDVSETALEEARKKGLNVSIADVENLPFEDGSFDVVTCMEVLSHLFDPSKAVKEIQRVLKKRGILLGSCPHKNLETYAWEDKRMHRRYYDEQELHQLLGASFDRSWIKVLSGGQFAMSLANSFLGNQPAEMLFKSGNGNILGWDAALQDRSILRCWFGFTQGPGDVYYRMSGFADKMQKLGAEVHYNSYEENDFQSTSAWAHKIRYLPAEKRITNLHIVHELESLLKAADMSVFQITSSRDVLLILTAMRDPLGLRQGDHKPMLTEIDDWMFDLASYNLAAQAYRPNSDMEAVAFDQLKMSDAIICSTEYIKGKLAELVPNKPVYVIKNSLDFDIWDKLERPTKLHDENPELIRIGYSGCGNHSGDLELIAKPIEALLEEFPNLEFVSLPFPSTDSIKNERYKRFQAWVGISIFPQVLADWELDIGLAPLRDNEMNRAKSNLRWLEYSALKVPTLASPIYPFSKSVTHNKDGVLVSNSEKEWYQAMRELILNKEKRRKLGEAAYKTVRKDYDMDKVAKTYLSVLKAVKHDFIKKVTK